MQVLQFPVQVIIIFIYHISNWTLKSRVGLTPDSV